MGTRISELANYAADPGGYIECNGVVVTPTVATIEIDPSKKFKQDNKIIILVGVAVVIIGVLGLLGVALI